MGSNINLHRRLAELALSLGLLFLGKLAFALEDSVTFERVSLAEGLSQSNIYAFAEDGRGYLWMGTQSAADRFDGFQIQSFRHDPADSSSLTSGAVNSFYLAGDGFFWISTNYGVSRFDPTNNSIKRVLEFESIPDRPLFSLVDGLKTFCEDQLLAIFSNTAWRIDLASLAYEPLPFEGLQSQTLLAASVRDPQGQVWISDGEHLWVSDCTTDAFVHHSSALPLTNIQSFGSDVLTITHQGNVAWATSRGVLIIDPRSSQVIGNILPSTHGDFSDLILAVSTDPIGGLWALTTGELLRIEPDTTGATALSVTAHYRHNLDPTLIGNRPSMQTARSSDGLIWISALNSVAAYRPDDRSFHVFRHNPRDGRSLPPAAGSIGYDLFVDRFGVLWIGGKLGGLARYVPQRHRFIHIRDLDLISYVVRGIAEVQKGSQRQLWVGLDDEGIQFWTQADSSTFEKQTVEAIYRDEKVDASKIRVRSMVTHPITGDVWFNGALWFGQIDSENASVVLLSQNTTEFMRRRALAFSPDGRFLYQSDGETLIQHELNAQGERIGERRLDWLPEKIDQLLIGAITVLTDGTVLMVAANRLFAVQPWSQQVSLIRFSDPTLQDSRVVSMLNEGSTLWLGTRDHGFLETALETSDGKLVLTVRKRWGFDEGLPDVTIYAIARDLAGHLWISSNRGLTRIDPTGEQVLNFTPDDGLQAEEFNTGVVHRTPDGRIYFGGINGLNLFDPSAIKPHPIAPLVHLRSFEVNQQRTDANTTLYSHDENNWTIEYVGIHSMFPKRNRFAYQLEGLDPSWVEAGPQRIARYAGLAPGKYRFLVKSANGDGLWSEPHVLLEATIQPPPWLSPVASIFYVLLAVILTMGLIIRARQREIKLQNLIDQRTEELKTKNDLVVNQSEALQEALNARTLFFANVSHELRTPLTLIDANLNRLDERLPNEDSILIAKRYLSRLTRLVDQLLDLSKIKLHGVQTEAVPWSVDALVESTIAAYESVAQTKRIQLSFSRDGQWYTRADQVSVEKILLNLITNAVKFTPANGFVKISLQGDPKSGLWIHIKDTGPGIPLEEQQLIFERFYRIPIQEAQRTTGAGIGLSLVAEAVAAIGGTIKLISQLNHGSTFSVWIPATQHPDELGLDPALPHKKGLSEADTDTELAVLEQTESSDTPKSNDPDLLGTLMVVEDNLDLQQHLSQSLSGRWRVVTAGNGVEALACLERYDIDVIVSDIMMPRMDGLTLLTKVRDDLRTSHIPFLFLTARSDDETELQSLMLSVDDFVRKPFDADVLSLKLKNLWINRQRLRTYLGQPRVMIENHVSQVIDGKAISPRDHRFMERLKEFMAQHFHDSELSVARLASALAMDERTLQRKIRGLYDQTPAHFINEYRIQEACRRLEDPAAEVQEVAFQCGYNSSQYFARVFKQHRGESPSQWRQTTKSSAFVG